MFISLIAMMILYQIPQMVAGQETDPSLIIGGEHNQSNNWAGTFTSVTGSWIVPNVTAQANSRMERNELRPRPSDHGSHPMTRHGRGTGRSGRR